MKERKTPLSESDYRKLLLLDISKQHRSWKALIRNNWIIKFSIYRSNILFLFVHKVTGQSIVRFFTDEDEACDFINFMVDTDGNLQE